MAQVFFCIPRMSANSRTASGETVYLYMHSTNVFWKENEDTERLADVPHTEI